MKYDTINQIFEIWESVPKMAKETGIIQDTLYGMKRRNSIAHWHWETIIQAAEKRGVTDLSKEVFSRLVLKERAERLAA
ncbi:hypothetical protein [Pseudovibrio sp. POLY-S9]|uniref:hypothetical protein n=1 Tax=Pseudovibrio sp. POLY-S9 TaxID=1576596 RepID=UPI00128F7160|nr:hypothetical protein [Pseudovibrio sp. POLY-S9]